MPSSGIALNIIGAQPGYWIVRVYPLVDNRPCPIGTMNNAYLSAGMAKADGSSFRAEEKVNERGYVEWDGTIDGSGADWLKKGYRVYAYFRRGDLVKETWVDLHLGFSKFSKGTDSNRVGNTTWEKWVNLVWKNVDAGIPWYIGLPYEWWWGYEKHHWFIEELADHIGRSDEPLWNSTAPVLEGLELVRCPIDGALLGFAAPGQEIRCPNDGFVSAWRRQAVKAVYTFGKPAVYDLSDADIQSIASLKLGTRVK